MMRSASELQYFLEVAKTKNLSRAAERVGISQPALSLAIQRLEHSLGVPVLIRSKTGVQLTKSGERLVGSARTLLNEWEKLRGETLRAEEEVRGTFKIGCHPSVALYTTGHYFHQLLSEYPNLELTLVHDRSSKIAEEVISFKIDFGIVVNPPPHPDLVIKHLFNDEVTTWVGPKKTTMQNLKSGGGVLIHDPSVLQTESLLRKMSRKGMKYSRLVTCSNFEVIMKLVSDGSGVGVIPTRVAKLIPTLGLKHSNPKGPIFLDKICLIYRADAQKSKASKTISSFIGKQLIKSGRS